MVVCKNCEQPLVYCEGELRCPECGKVWNELLLADTDCFDETIEPKYNALFAYEYHKLRSFIKDKQVYGALLQIKDIYEVLMKLPVLLAASYFFGCNGTEAERTFLVALVNQKNSMGNWLDHLQTVKKRIKQRNELLPLYNVVCQTADFCIANDVVHWRNSNIGHGAVKTMDDGNLYGDLFKRIASITELLHKLQPTYEQIRIYLQNGDKRILLNGRENAFAKEQGELLADVNGTVFPLSPFFYIVDDGFYFYDNYYSKKSYLDIVEYPRGNRDIRQTHVFDDLCNGYNFGSNVYDDVISKTEIEISDSVLNVSDFVEPKFVTEWIAERIENDDRVFLLQMQKGMGKSTYVRALDPFLINKIKLEETCVRTYYVNPTFGSKFSNFASEVFRQLSHNDNMEQFNGDYHYLHADANDRRRELADALNRAKRMPQFNRQDNLLFVIDGLDEINMQEKVNLTEFIPTADMLDEGVFVMLTSRTLAEDDGLTFSVKNFLESLRVPTLSLKLDDKRYAATKIKYLNDHVLAPLRAMCKRKKAEFVYDEAANVQLVNKISGDSMLYLRQLKELAQIKAAALLDKGAKRLDGNEVLSNGDKPLLDEYFASLQSNYGGKYYRQFVQIMVTFALVDDYLSIEDLSYMVVNGSISLAFVGFINTIRMFLSVKRNNHGNSYKISHLENVNYIRNNMGSEILEMADTLFQKIKLLLADKGVEIHDKFDMTFMPYFVNIARAFHDFGDEELYCEALNIARDLFETQPIYETADYYSDILLDRNIHYQHSLQQFAEMHGDGSKRDALALARSHIDCAGFLFAQRDGAPCLEEFRKAYELLKNFDLTDDEKFEMYFSYEPNFIFLLDDCGTPEEITVYADWADKIWNELENKNYPFSPESRCYHETVRGYYYHATKQWEKSIPYFEKAVKYTADYTTLSQKWTHAAAISNLGKSHSQSGHFDEALKYYTEARKLLDECVNSGYIRYIKEIWYSYRRLANMYRMSGQTDKAAEEYRKGLEFLEQKEREDLLANKVFIVYAYQDLAGLYLFAEDYENCIAYHKKSVEIFDRLNEYQKNTTTGKKARKTIDDRIEELRSKGVSNV